MYLDILTPDQTVFSGEITSVQVPGTAGRFEVLINHAPIISTLEKGDVVIRIAKEEKIFVIDGGVVEVLHDKVIVLAEAIL
ncbi:ATP synthase F1 subunit epsilon [uncultured Cytophaga sp.]|uniref:ATP synthase F1 subunit epsilon n=1 Tax=uncultured Cytophaga sp. TaxID=160238 RepID=UPI0026024734|nr:ATP synthase F1 subunit epsilon [uncultured Cytophaga sp.]